MHLKKSLLDKMPGDDWQKFANLRLLFGYQWAQPGKKLLFQGGEIGQWREWDHEGSVDWDFARHGNHQGLQKWVRDLNRLHTSEAALHELDFEPAGFDWIDCNDPDQSTFSFLRYSEGAAEAVAAVFNFTPVPRHGFRLGVPFPGRWTELANSDAEEYGGSGLGNLGAVEATDEPAHSRPHSLEITLPPLATLFFKGVRPPEPTAPPQEEVAASETAGSGEPEGESKVQSPKSKGAGDGLRQETTIRQEIQNPRLVRQSFSEGGSKI